MKLVRARCYAWAELVPSIHDINLDEWRVCKSVQIKKNELLLSFRDAPRCIFCIRLSTLQIVLVDMHELKFLREVK